MHAVVETGGKQYRVTAGDIIQVEKCVGNVGDQIEIRSLLLLQDDQGIALNPTEFKDAKVVAEILQQGRTRKVLVFKKKRRKNYRKTLGHRQAFTRLKVVEISR